MDNQQLSFTINIMTVNIQNTLYCVKCTSTIRVKQQVKYIEETDTFYWHHNAYTVLPAQAY